MTWNWAKSPWVANGADNRAANWTAKLWFVPAAVAALDSLTSLTGWANFAHHDTAHGVSAFGQALMWAALGIFFTRRQRTQ